MAGVAFRATYNGGALESRGNVFSFSTTWNPSPIALLTNGFVIDAGDIWSNDEHCEESVWANAETVSSGSGSQLPWVAAYFTGYNLPTLVPSQVDYTCMTHLMHFALLPVTDGSLDESQLSNGESTDSNPYSAEIIWRAHQEGVKVLITIGGASEGSHFNFATAPETLPTFVDNIMEFFTRARTWSGADVSYDGIDIDWEDISNHDRYQNLITALRGALDGLNLSPSPLLTTSVNTTLVDPDIVDTVVSVKDDLDQINVLTYPYGYVDSVNFINPLEGSPSITEQMSDFVAQIPAAKLGFGIDFDAVTFPGFLGPSPSDPDTFLVEATYHDVMATYYPGVPGPTGTTDAGNYKWDSTAKVPYLSIPGGGDYFVTFENETSIALKISYAKEQGFGVFCWELSAAYRADLPASPDALMQAVKADAAVEPGNITTWTLVDCCNECD